ncbi:MAG TPA: hypothetical protein VE983_12585 [Solirubrobacteraceae bacterium]|nr:hypothetical protein [Solirubrobacteraceae bacterium]
MDQRASQLLERERAAVDQVEAADRATATSAGRIQAMRARRRLRRRRTRLERLRNQRRELIHEQLRSIMFALQRESQQARDELDRELERLVPVQEHWERVREAFEDLEETIGRPAFASLADQWRGQLEIPEFPLAERGAYVKPFPEHALLF